MNTIKQFLQEVNSISFLKRVFGWSSIKRLLVDAMAELQILVDTSEKYRELSEETAHELDTVSLQVTNGEKRIAELQREKDVQAAELNRLRTEVNNLTTQVARMEKADETRQNEQLKAMSTLSALQNRVSDERAKEVAAKQQAELQVFEQQKETWSKHQTDTKNKIKLLCEKHTIEYVDKVPFRGDPDNTILICGEMVVFDAKSPANADLTNFPNYLKGQAEAASKYADKENVRSDIFFVVPANTLPVLTNTMYEFAKHRVFIIPAESLEPVFLNLKKIEDYEFAEQMSPEDRENICRILGRLAHHIKRRVQVDNYFGKEALSLASDCNSLLPSDVIDEVIKIERAIRLNPPQERSGKGIALTDLQKESLQVEKGLEERGVLPSRENLAKGLNDAPLYKENE